MVWERVGPQNAEMVFTIGTGEEVIARHGISPAVLKFELGAEEGADSLLLFVPRFVWMAASYV